MITSILKLKRYPYDRALNDLDHVQSMSISDLKSWQDEQKWDIAKYHYHNNPFYRSIIGNLPESWIEIPSIDKSHLTNGKDIFSLLSDEYRYKRKLYISNTSGSSGHPFYFAKDKYAHARTWAYIDRRYSDLGLSLSDKQARFYGIPLNFKSYVTEKTKDYLMNRVRFPVMDLSDGSINKMIEQFKKYSFIYIYGYAQSLVFFINYLSRNNINIKEICPTLRVIISTSEMLSIDEKENMESITNLPVYNEYGASETGYMATWNQKGYWDSCDENIYIEVDSNGELLVTDLFNRAMPFIRYRIGDMAELDVSNRNRTKIINLLGRTNDLIKLPSGKKAAGLTFYYISRSLLESSNIKIHEFIIRQTALDAFSFDIVSEDKITKKNIIDINDDAIRYLEPGITIDINQVDSIVRPEGRKIQHFYSEIN